MWAAKLPRGLGVVAREAFFFLRDSEGSLARRAVGGRQWGALRGAIRVALFTAIVTSAVCMAVVYMCKEGIYTMFGAAATVRVEADSYVFFCILLLQFT